MKTISRLEAVVHGQNVQKNLTLSFKAGEHPLLPLVLSDQEHKDGFDFNCYLIVGYILTSTSGTDVI